MILLKEQFNVRDELSVLEVAQMNFIRFMMDTMSHQQLNSQTYFYVGHIDPSMHSGVNASF